MTIQACKPASDSNRMEVIAVSRSVPQWLDINGQRVWSSIVRAPLISPVDSIILDPSTGITGNKSAAHDGQVYAFFSHHYDYWADRLGVQRDTWDWCHWGENITLRCDTNLSESDIHLGDIWEVGTDVMLQVCGSRVPCFKLSWRCGQEDKWLQELAASGKCGIYLKVLRGGAIHPGDTAILRQRRSGCHVIDCATITRLAFNQSMSTRDTMDLLADDPDLLNMNKLIFRRKLSIIRDQSLHKKNAWKGWRELRVFKAVRESQDVKSFYLVARNERPLAAYLPGQFLAVRIPIGLSRCWSISTYAAEDMRASPPFYRLSIKRAGKASQWMHDSCKPGTVLQVQSPSGAFCLDWSPQFPGRQVYISAGIGITPMLAMLQAHLHHPAMKRAPAVWIHVSRTADAVPFSEELGGLLETPEAKATVGLQAYLFLSGGSNVTTDPTLSTSASTVEIDEPRVYDFGHQKRITTFTGRPTMEIMKDILAGSYFMDPLQITPIEVEGKYSTFYICGPSAFETSIRDHLANIGVAPAMVLSEAFQSPMPGKSTIDRGEVIFKLSGRRVSWKRQKPSLHNTVNGEEGSKDPGTAGEHIVDKDSDSEDPGPSILEIAEQAGLTPDYGCRVGTCGSCEVALSCGSVVGGLQLEGTVRVCVARPGSKLVEVDM